MRPLVMDALDGGDVEQLTEILGQILHRVDPEGSMRPVYQKHDAAAAEYTATHPRPAGEGRCS